MDPVCRPLRAGRNVMLAAVWRLTYRGARVDLTGYTGRLAVRQYEGAPGSPLFALGLVTSAVEGIRIPYPMSGEVEIRIAKTTLQALPAGRVSGDARRPDDLQLAHELLLTDPTGLEQAWVFGVLTVHSGVNS